MAGRASGFSYNDEFWALLQASRHKNDRFPGTGHFIETKAIPTSSITEFNTQNSGNNTGFSTPMPGVINREDQIPVDDHVLLNHATMGSGRDMVTLSAGLVRSRSAQLARNSANIQHAPIAATL